MLMEYLQEIDCKLCVIMETWLSKKDKIWKESSRLRKNGFDMIAYNTEVRNRGGIALVFKENYKVKQKVEKNLRIFQYATLSVAMDKLHQIILGLYHRPNSKVKKYSNGDFIDEFPELMVEMILSYDNLIIMGDFSLHLNNLDDPDSEFFIDTIKALGLQQ